jgi:hypothetical protein
MAGVTDSRMRFRGLGRKGVLYLLILVTRDAAGLRAGPAF